LANFELPSGTLLVQTGGTLLVISDSLQKTTFHPRSVVLKSDCQFVNLLNKRLTSQSELHHVHYFDCCLDSMLCRALLALAK
jgi:hypothetical protein